MIKAVVFDFDGTLVDSFEDIARAANHSLEVLGFPTYSLEQVKRCVGRGLENLMRSLLPPGSNGILEEAVRELRRYYADHPFDYSTVYPGVSELLDWLGEHHLLRAVLSNKTDPFVQIICENLGLSTRMEEIHGHRDEFPLKPDPASLNWILSRHGISPCDTLMVGDHLPDLELSQRAGTQFCAVTYGILSREQWEQTGVQWIVDSAAGLQVLLLSQLRKDSELICGNRKG